MDFKLGKTGEYPQGKLNKDDEGELKLAVFIDKGKIIIDFGTPVKWLGFGKEEAKILAKAIIEKSERI